MEPMAASIAAVLQGVTANQIYDWLKRVPKV